MLIEKNRKTRIKKLYLYQVITLLVIVRLSQYPFNLKSFTFILFSFIFNYLK